MSKIIEKPGYTIKWTITRYANQAEFERDNPYHESVFSKNVQLKEGIQNFIQLLIGTGGTNYGNANAHIGVGDSAAAEDPNHTGLQGTAKFYKAVEASYPQTSNETVTWRSIFQAGEATQSWQEFTVCNANSDAGDNLNRKVQDEGTKGASAVWTVDVAITYS